MEGGISEKTSLTFSWNTGDNYLEQFYTQSTILSSLYTDPMENTKCLHLQPRTKIVGKLFLTCFV